MKEKDLEFIRKFGKISVVDICKKLNVNRNNLLKGRTTEEKTRLVKEEILNKIKEIS